MPLYSYLCSIHGEHDKLVRSYKVPKTSECPDCGEITKNVITSPIIVDVKLDWNDKAHDYRRDPYTQAKAQLRNMDREDQEHKGARPQKWREAQIQEAAKQIDRKNKGIKPKSIVSQTIKKALREN